MTRYRPRSATIYSSIVMGGAALLAVITVIDNGFGTANVALAFLVLLAALAYAAYFRPSVEVYEDRVRLVNVVTIATIPFSRLDRIATRWALEMHADDGTQATAFAAPAPGASKSRRISLNEAHWGSNPASLYHTDTPTAQPGTASGDAASIVDHAFAAWCKANPGACAPGATTASADAATSSEVASDAQKAKASGKAIVRQPNWLSIAVLVAGVVMFFVSF